MKDIGGLLLTFAGTLLKEGVEVRALCMCGTKLAVGDTVGVPLRLCDECTCCIFAFARLSLCVVFEGAKLTVGDEVFTSLGFA